VNFRGYKNIMGVLNQPEFVICDMNLLKTLPEREVLCGLAEIVKHGAIANADLFSYIEEHDNEALTLHADVIEKLVYDSVVIKTAVVNQDEREDGERKKLNFGHTFGHAIEKVTGIPHGEAVSAGMVVAARLSEKRGNISPADTNRIETLLRKLKLPTELPLNKAAVLDALMKDKKRKGDLIDFVLLQGIGNAVLEEIPIRELEDVVREW
jgi:3-dehydroquinate synthase